MCVIVSARIPNPNEDPTLADKEAILASLNVKAMQVIFTTNMKHYNLLPQVSEIDYIRLHEDKYHSRFSV